ncbi:hypothetical protein [Gluconobacter frateurii]|uniref:Uncharacterized protein n=1 Tax=Gluconobacter frateurii NRIC 0228 TaxID=1307946 RepID=A0ABQ0QEF8_9PROT|nr:hypothetical protein [Gluconobacter frateurii]GBR15630.1 hypothetical protein AA0228_2564 [Gluconobacter frateurii NRIC 0228]GLP90360.1 hypothetical protein GCM10007868_14350 [Gluconobacter frateurii]
MSTGDQSDFVRRLRGLLPRGWFPDPVATGSTEQAPVLVGILSGFGSALAGAWTLLQQVRSSTRLSTSTGSVLDLAANDLFGVGQFPRTSGEADASYLARIEAALIAKKNTRSALSAALTAAGATQSQIVECWNAADCGALLPAGATRGLGGYGASALRYSGRPGQFFLETAVTADVLPIVRKSVVQTKAAGVVAWIRNIDPTVLKSDFGGDIL